MFIISVSAGTQAQGLIEITVLLRSFWGYIFVTQVLVTKMI